MMLKEVDERKVIRELKGISGFPYRFSSWLSSMAVDWQRLMKINF